MRAGRLPAAVTVLSTVLWLAAAPASAQESAETWSLDPSALPAESDDLLLRAPDEALDGLFQALHAGAQSPRDAQALCALFDPEGDRSMEGLNRTAAELSDGTRDRFAEALAGLLVGALQSPPQPFDLAQARQALKANLVRAALLHEGFSADLAGTDHPARCRAVAQLLGVLQARPLSERAAVTRLLMREGLDRLASTAVAP